MRSIARCLACGTMCCKAKPPKHEEPQRGTEEYGKARDGLAFSQQPYHLITESSYLTT
jgi:hypothetical protein